MKNILGKIKTDPMAGSWKQTLIKALPLFLIFVVALLLRLKIALSMNQLQLAFADAINYDAMARQFVAKGFLGYMTDKPNAYITPGYPLFLSAVYYLAGLIHKNPLNYARYVQSLIGALTCIVVYFIGKRARNKSVGLIAAAAYAIYPSFAWSPSLILTETLNNFLFLAYVYLLIRVLETKKAFEAVLCGFVFALAVMVRPVVFPLFLVPFAYGYFRSRDKQLLKILAYGYAGILVVMVPWWIRNLLTMHKFIMLATQTGNPFIGGITPYLQPTDLAHYKASNQVAEGFKMIMHGLRTEPFLYVKWFTIGKFNVIFDRMWTGPSEEYQFLKSLSMVHFGVITVGWLGAGFALIRKRMGLIAFFAVTLTLLQLVFIPDPRYAYAIIPMLILLMADLIDYTLFRSKAVEER